MLAEFVEDEKAFVCFLKQAPARLTDTAALYDSVERDTKLRMTEISRQLDGDQE